jgi:hypothetical protein
MLWIFLPKSVIMIDIAKKIPLETLSQARNRTGLNQGTTQGRVDLNNQEAAPQGNCAC